MSVYVNDRGEARDIGPDGWPIDEDDDEDD